MDIKKAFASYLSGIGEVICFWAKWQLKVDFYFGKKLNMVGGLKSFAYCDLFYV